jgi:ribose transport system permease protein
MTMGKLSATRPARLSRGWHQAEHVGVTVALAVLVVVLAVTQPNFATTGNAVNILETNAVLLIAAIGLTFVLLVGGFDLSVGGTVALSGILLATLSAHMADGLAVAVVLVGAFVVGFLSNGLLIGRIGLSFFVVTLGTASLFRGVALVITEGRTLTLHDYPFLLDMGRMHIGGLPLSVVVALGLLVAAYIVTRFTGFGRMVYAVGGNPEAARLAGINVPLVRATAYMICTACAALAGVLEAARLASASPTVATGLELSAGAAVLLGGTSFLGGSGGVIGTLIGALFLGTMSNGLTLAGISSFWQSVVAGAVLLAAVLIDKLRLQSLDKSVNT